MGPVTTSVRITLEEPRNLSNGPRHSLGPTMVCRELLEKTEIKTKNLIFQPQENNERFPQRNPFHKELSMAAKTRPK